MGWVLCLVFAAASGWLGYLVLAKGTADAPAPPGTVAAVNQPPASAPPALPPGAEGGIVLEASGYIIPAHQVLVSPQVSGRLVEVSIEEGQRVASGQVLAVIEQTDYAADVARAEAALELARQRHLELERGMREEEKKQAAAELREAEEQWAEVQAKLRTSRPLLNSKAVAALEYEQWEIQSRALSQRIERLKYALELMNKGPREERKAAALAEVRQQEAELAKAKWRLDNCTIRAPIGGTILRKNAEQGNIVNPVAFNGSFSLCEMADLSDLEVELYIEERDIARVQQGQRCRVRAEAFPGRVYQGIVSRLMPIADRAKGAVPVRVKLRVPAEEKGVYLKPQMRATVSFLRTAPADRGAAGSLSPLPSRAGPGEKRS